MKIKYASYLFHFLIIAFVINLYPQEQNQNLFDSLAVHFNRKADVSVGSPYVGVEFHNSRILPQRISFFYPAANSIDLSSDYFKRDTTYIMSLALKIGNRPFEWLGQKPYEFILTPYEVKYFKSDSEKSIMVSYQFCNDKPAMVLTIEITNESNQSENFEFYSHLETSLKTCHTYALIDKARTTYDKGSSTIYSNFDDLGTQYAQVFVSNAGEKPVSFNTVGNLDDKGYENINLNSLVNYKLEEKVLSKINPGIPAAEFLYKKTLNPHQKMTIVQIIGSSKQSEGEGIVEYLLNNYIKEIIDYERSILININKGNFITGNKNFDKTYKWARGILAVNKHYLDGQVVPMPCPAEYNFYFTHDVLVTDYAAVNFDLSRVKNDLEYIISHADKNFIIPHAYYWKDTAYKTEYATSDNWNNFWFIIVSGSYFKHSNDLEFLNRLYPYISKCVEQTLLNKKDDNLMWEAHIDGSDLGNSYGPRSYMTSLAVKSLKEYVYISYMLGKDINSLMKYETLANEMQKALNEKLWSDKQEYLINYYKGGKLDTHYYTGSLIAPHFKLLDEKRTGALVKSASDHLLDPKIGIYSIYPMDLEKLKDFLELKDDETGKPFYYGNGGIWFNANAWYALDLIADNKKDDAYNFIKNTMTLDGITNSPNGQPAMYEYRISDYNNPEVYGKIDKPQFLWAAGWYLYSLYHLFGVDESAWNIVFNPYLLPKEKLTSFTISYQGRIVKVKITGKGDYLKKIIYDGKEYPSLVLPAKIDNLKEINYELGKPEYPYIKNTNSQLISGEYNKSRKELSVLLKAFPGHKNKTEIVSPARPKAVFIEGSIVTNWISENINSAYILKIKLNHKGGSSLIKINFY